VWGWLAAIGPARWPGRAVEADTDGVELSRQVGDRDMEGAALDGLGDAHAATGHRAAAREAWERSPDILEALGRPAAREIRAKLAGT
jgi:hypothetical protein